MRRSRPASGGVSTNIAVAVFLIFKSGLLLAQAITEFPTPSGGFPSGITVGSDGNLWFTEGTMIGRITTGGSVTEFPIE
jgi:hypothetical protein